MADGVAPVGLMLRGRRHECAVFDGLLEAARAGRSGVLVVRGEAGVGKTALLEYAIESASDLGVVRAVGVESERELAFATLHHVCAPILDRLERLPGPQRDALAVTFGLSQGEVPDRFFVALAVLSLVAEVADDRPLLCVVDDAQWLDQASAQALAFVARRLLAESVVVLFAAREPVEALVGLPELVVEGLQDDDARELLRSVLPGRLDDRIREQVVTETGGNPLALLELTRGLSPAQLAGGFGLPAALSLPGRIEERFVARLETLPEDSRRLLLVAAAEPTGDPEPLWRAAHRLGISGLALDPASVAGLLEVGVRLRFRHPLVRSAVYHAASPEERRRVHKALAEAIDARADPDRRAWHLAEAAAGPDEDVAAELERAASRAQARGGLAAAAAFLGRAVVLTPDPARRAERALTAAQASLYAGAFDAALRLVAEAEARATSDFQRARADLLRAEIDFASSRGSGAPASLLRAAKRIEPFDARLARASYLEALSAAMFAARLAGPGGGVRDVAQAVQAAPSLGNPRSAADLLLDGWAALFADGCATAAPALQEALRKFTDGMVGADELHLLWLATITAPVVWDDARWEALSRGHVELARNSGALSELPLALNSRIYIHLFKGELDAAGALIEEARTAIEATRASLTPWGAVALAVLRGGEQDASAILDVATADATSRGEGISLTVIAWAGAVLYNGLALYEKAFSAAREAIDCPTNSAAAAWGMVELIESATRVGESRAAAEASERFEATANAAGSDWALGVNARSLALLSTGSTAEQRYRESLDRLRRCQMRLELARAHLLYGEWLRRENRRVDAREELRTAHEMFTAMGVGAFAGRAERELLATGEHVRKRTVESPELLTAQETQIARLARDGVTNAEIGARLFISRRTVEYHLSKVFTKLGIRSRHDLHRVLPEEPTAAVAS
jgi:DNA-binding CsgD family transcriptional regulator